MFTAEFLITSLKKLTAVLAVLAVGDSPAVVYPASGLDSVVVRASPRRMSDAAHPSADTSRLFLARDYGGDSSLLRQYSRERITLILSMKSSSFLNCFCC